MQKYLFFFIYLFFVYLFFIYLLTFFKDYTQVSQVDLNFLIGI